MNKNMPVGVLLGDKVVYEGALAEGMKTVADLPDNIGVRVDRRSPESYSVRYAWISDWRPATGALEGVVGFEAPTSGGECSGAFEVTWSNATYGWGPLLYDIAMEIATELGGGLMSDRHSVSGAAHAVWTKYDIARRADVKADQLDDFPGTLTPTTRDDCAQQSAKEWAGRAKKPWPSAPESRRFRKEGKKTLKALRETGRLLFSSAILARELGFMQPYESTMSEARFAGVVPYVSPRERDLTPEEAHRREVAYALKTGEPWAVKEAAHVMALKIPHGAILVPVPGSKGDIEANTKLADAIAHLIGGTVVPALGRTQAVPSSRELRVAGGKGIGAVAQMGSMGLAAEIPTNKPVVMIDNVTTSGATMKGGWIALGKKPNVTGLAYAKALAEGYQSGDVLLVPEVAQTSDFSCGAAAMLAVLQYWGVAKEGEREEDLREPLMTDEETGTDISQMERLARMRGLEAHLDRGLNLDMLHTLVREGWIVVPEMQAWPNAPVRDGAELDYGHYVVVMSCAGGRVLVMDPALRDNDSPAPKTQYGWVPLDEFERAWLDDQGTHGVAVVIRAKDGRKGPRGPMPVEPVRVETGREQPLVNEGHQVPEDVAARVAALTERAGPDGWVDMLEEASKILLPPVPTGYVRLYRGTPMKHNVQSLSKADPYALFGPGIYLTSSKRIAGDYTTKGAREDTLFNYHGRSGMVSKAAVIAAFIRQTARYMDDAGRPTWEQSGLPHENDAWRSGEEEQQAPLVHKAEALWKKMEKTHEVRISADGTAVIRKKTAPYDLAVYDVPKEWIDRTIDAEAEIDEDVAMAMYYALGKDKFASQLYDAATTKDEDGFLPTFRAIYGGAREELGNVATKFRAELKERGIKVKGVSYAGGVTIGGAGNHDAYAFWDEQGLAKLRVNESIDEARPPKPLKPTPGAKRAAKLVQITQKANDKEAGEADRHQMALTKIRQAEQDAARAAFARSESVPSGVLIQKGE